MSFMIELLPAMEHGWETIVYVSIVSSVAGVVTGLFYRVGAIIVLSLVGIIATFIVGFGRGWTFQYGFLFGFVLIAALQLSYLLGVVVSVLRSRKEIRDARRSLVESALPILFSYIR